MTGPPAGTGAGSGDLGLGLLAARVPEPLQRTAAYDVPVPPRLVAKLDANELPYALPAELRGELGRALAEVALERYPDAAARRLREVVVRQLSATPDPAGGPGARIRPITGDQVCSATAPTS